MNELNFFKSNKGITIVSLVVTIIVLIILAGVSISAIWGENGIITVAKQAKENIEQAQIDEQTKLNELYTQIEMEDDSLGDVSNDAIDKLTKFKKIIAEAITNKGIETSEGDTAETMAENIEKLGDASVKIKADGSWNGAVNVPKIEGTGLKPVYWNGTEWVKLTSSSSQEEWAKWYDYGGEKWANAQSADGSMWVWIPRYEYKIDSTSKMIHVRFIPTDVKSGTTGYTIASTGIVKSSDGYTIHPAFMDDSANTYSNGGWDSELPGFWIAKYAAGFQNGTVGEEAKTVEYSDLKYTTINSSYTSNFLTASLTTDTNISYPVFKANTYAYNLISVGDAYLLSQKIATADMYGLSNVDSHMVKNSEWGAVAYLAHSKYGVNGNSSAMNEVTINSKNLNNSIYVNNATSGTKANVYAVTSYGNSNTANDVSASSTKNMTGVFDLNGCVWERTAAFYKGGSTSTSAWYDSMADSTTLESTKYVTLYESNNKVGDATNETSGWNSDFAYFVSSSYPVFERGGDCDKDGNIAGLFSFFETVGDPYFANGFRACLISNIINNEIMSD